MGGFFDNFLTPQGVQAAAQAAGAAAGGDWAAVASTLGQQAVRSVTVRTQFSPPVTVDPFAPAPPSTAPNPILMLLKPEVTIESPGGGRTVIAPYGTPSQNYLPWLIAGVVVVFLGVAGALGYVFARARR